MAGERPQGGVVDRVKATGQKAVEVWQSPKTQAMKDELVDAARRSPGGLFAGWTMTLGRIPLTVSATRDAIRGDWWKAGIKFAVGGLLDLDGRVVRHYGVATEAGAIADPTTDGVLRAGAAVSVGIKAPITAGLVAAGEVLNLKYNGTIQAERSKNNQPPFVPNEAKNGTAAQMTGAPLLFVGIAADNPRARVAGKAALLAGTALRVHAYGKEYRRIKKHVPK